MRLALQSNRNVRNIIPAGKQCTMECQSPARVQGAILSAVEAGKIDARRLALFQQISQAGC